MPQNWYGRHMLPHLLDIAGRLKPLLRQREKIVPLASGVVLEVGFGAGLNMPYYDKTAVDKIFGLEPSLCLADRARKRIAREGLDVEIVRAQAEKIPFKDKTFDSALMTYTLCSIQDPPVALREIHRILKPDGRLVFCEHGLAPEESVRRWQGTLTFWWEMISGGCHLNRDVPALLKEASFDCSGISYGYISSLRILSYNYWGEVSKRIGFQLIENQEAARPGPRRICKVSGPATS